MKKQFLRTVRSLLFLALAVFLLYLAFRGIDVGEVWRDLQHARYAWLLVLLPVGLLSHLFRAWRWNILIRPLGYRPPLSHTFYAVMSGYLANLALPRLGEVVRCGSLTRTDRIPFDKLIGTVITERIIDLLILLFLTVVTFFIKIHFFGAFFRQHIFVPLGERFSALFSGTSLLVMVAAGALLVLLLFLLRKRIGRSRLFRKVVAFVRGIGQGMRTILQMEDHLLFFLSSALIWLMYYLTAWLVVYTLPGTSSLTAVDGLFLLVVGSFGMVVPVQGGLGAYHLIVSSALTLYGIPRETGLALATIAHESQTLLILVVGAFSMIMVVMLKRRPAGSKKTDAPSAG